FRMTSMMDIMRLDHPLQVAAPFLRAPLESLMDDYIMKNEIEKAIEKNAKPCCKHIRVIRHLAEVIEESDRWQAEHHCKQIIFFEGVIMYRMMRLVPRP